MPAKSKFVKVFGERNTGTRAMIRMLRSHPDIRTRADHRPDSNDHLSNSEFRSFIDRKYRGKWRKIYLDALLDNQKILECPTRAWKHTLPVWDEAYDRSGAHVIFCVRNPYSWAVSLSKKPYHQQGPRTNGLEAILAQPWLTLARENMPPLLRSPLELWNGKVQAYREFAKSAVVPTFFIRFEDFVSDPENTLRLALKSFDVEPSRIPAMQTSTKSKWRTLAEISEYYRSEVWKAALSSSSVEAINSAVNWELASEFGYRRLDPKDFAQSAKKTTLKSSCRSHSSMLHSGSR